MIFTGNLANGRTVEGGFYVEVKVNGKVSTLSPLASQAVINHSPNGFNWGYGGSGPAQLALALLLKTTGNKNLALRHYQDFKWEIVAKFGNEWKLSADEISDWIEKRKHE